MLLITICVGSSCSLRGSDELAMEIQKLIQKEHLDGLVDIVGAFCMDARSKGVSVRVGEREFSGIKPEKAEEFFYKEIFNRVNRKLLTKHTD
jgi:NADH:ubiquinone oxidoreductase subunit E